MAITPINVGSAPDDGTGDPLRVAFQKTNANVGELDAQKAPHASPAFTGVPTAPTPAATDNSTRLQTTQGSLIQTRQFGIGTVAGAAYTPAIATHTTGGRFVADAAASAAAGLPLSALQHSIDYIPGVNAATGSLEATAFTGNLANANRKFFNKRNGGTLLGWQEFAFLTSTFPNLKIGNTPSADINTLDYYEEGSFTPFLSGATTAGTFTYTNQLGRYTRIGNKVFWSVNISISAMSGAAGGIRLAGMPYTTSTNSGNAGGINIGFFNGISGAGISGIQGLHSGGTSTVALYKYIAGAAAPVNLVPADLTTSFQMYASGFFTVD